MNYWLDLFTGTTWAEFRKTGANVSGFSSHTRSFSKKVKQGDIFLCYLTGVMRWVGALEVLGPSSDQRQIWKDQEFPVRFEVRPIVVLDPEHGVPMADLEGHVEFFAGPEHRGKYKGFVRQSPNLFRRGEDGIFVLDFLRRAEHEPVLRPVDPKKLSRKPLFKAEQRKGNKTIPTVVSVPDQDEVRSPAVAQENSSGDEAVSTTRHTEIQYHLLNLGTDMGLDVWVARNDRAKTWNGQPLGKMPGMISELPTQFNDATNRTIELIDVLWLKGNSIVAAFEVECTTSVYSRGSGNSPKPREEEKCMKTGEKGCQG